MVGPGDTFLGGAEVHGDDHLWIVLNDPAAHGGTALIVNVSTLRTGAERTCVLRRGDHPFIAHDSYVRFASAQSAGEHDLARLLRAGRLRAHRAMSQATLSRIRAGAAGSPFLRAELKALL